MQFAVAEAGEAASAEADEEELPEIRRKDAREDEFEARAREATARDPGTFTRAAEYEAFAPELAQVFSGEDPTLSALARDWAMYFTGHCDYELRAIFAGAALEHMRRKLKICQPWRDDLSVLLREE